MALNNNQLLTHCDLCYGQHTGKSYLLGSRLLNTDKSSSIDIVISMADIPAKKKKKDICNKLWCKIV
jgi:hypothetical protein